MKKLLLALTVLVGLASSASAVQISAFSQTSSSNTLTATANGTTSTSLSVSNAGVIISQLFGNVTPINADFSMSATSFDSAQLVAGLVVQHFNGTFCITSAVGCGGINFLSGTFHDAAVGANGGPGLVVNVSNPPDLLTLTSGVIPAADLAAPNSINFGFSNISTPPGLSICGNTLCSFTASLAGTVSANAVEATEPASLAVMGIGLLGLGFVTNKRKQNRDLGGLAA